MPDHDHNTPAAPGQALRAKAYDADLRAALSAYKAEQHLTNAQLARQIGVGETRVSKYLNGSPDGDVARLEQNARDVLAAAPARRGVAESLFETDASIEVATVCELIRKTNDIGLIHGPAGAGKTSGIDRYCASSPATIRVTLSRWDAGPAGLEASICDRLEAPRSRRERRSAWMLRTLTGSNRLLILDNAHRLTRGALAWLFDFWDATRLPIAMVGNPEVLTLIEENDQHFSRIGVVATVQVAEPESFAREMLRLHCPANERELLKLATAVAAERGHGRALLKHLLLVPEFMAVAGGDARRAFKLAHTRLVNAYSLED
jgi:DNA transposition AAA+ family ATPase